MRKKLLFTLVSCFFIVGCSDKQLLRQMPNLLGVWIGESVDEILSECAVKLGPKTFYTARKLIIEDKSIRQIADIVSVGEYDKAKARRVLFKLELVEFEHPTNDDLQEGYHVGVYEFDSNLKVFMPPNFDITRSGMDLRKRIISLTKNELILERRIKSNHNDSDCANKVDEYTVYRRIR